MQDEFGANEILTSLMLVYVADLVLDYLVRGPWRDPKGFNFPTTAAFEDNATVPIIIEGSRLHLGAVLALIAVAASWVLLSRTIKGFEISVVGSAPRAARFAGFDANKLTIFTFVVSGALAGLAGIIEVAGPVGRLQPAISPGYGFTAIIVAFLGRLNPIGILIAGLVSRAHLHRRRTGADFDQAAARRDARVSGHPAVLRARLRLAHPLSHPLGSRPEGDRCRCIEAIILTILAASTPLLIAAAGELVTERSGVLNLGVEGMMIMGAACGFVGAYVTGSTLIGALCGVVAGILMSMLFAALTLWLAVNQVATGLALTILGVGLSGLIGAGFVGERIVPAPPLDLPGLTSLPFVGRIVFGQNAFVYGSLVLVVAIWWFLYRTRQGLVLRAVGDKHQSAHALGYPVLTHPPAGSDVRRRLRGAGRRLPVARLYAVFCVGT